MANVRLGNTYFMDTTTALSGQFVVTHVTVTATAANSVLVLEDGTLGKKGEWRVATSGTTQMFDYSDNPIVFTTSINPTTATTIAATVLFKTRGTG